jgi:hypothetical protein
VSVETLIDLSRVSFQEADGVRSGSLNIAFFCGDAKENLVGQAWKPMDLKLTEEAYRRALKDGVACAAQIPVKGAVKYVKAVVYDYGGDLVGCHLSCRTRDERRRPGY